MEPPYFSSYAASAPHLSFPTGEQREQITGTARAVQPNEFQVREPVKKKRFLMSTSGFHMRHTYLHTHVHTHTRMHAHTHTLLEGTEAG